jgi:hypothetical protein
MAERIHEAKVLTAGCTSVDILDMGCFYAIIRGFCDHDVVIPSCKKVSVVQTPMQVMCLYFENLCLSVGQHRPRPLMKMMVQRTL